MDIKAILGCKATKLHFEGKMMDKAKQTDCEQPGYADRVSLVCKNSSVTLLYDLLHFNLCRYSE